MVEPSALPDSCLSTSNCLTLSLLISSQLLLQSGICSSYLEHKLCSESACQSPSSLAISASHPTSASSVTMSASLVELIAQRQAFYMSAELLTVREALIGSDPLIQLLKIGHPVEALWEAFHSNTEAHSDCFINIANYVTQVSVGDAVLRHKGELPPVPVRERERAPAVGPIRALEMTRPRWEALYAYCERERESGELKGDVAYDTDFRTNLTTVHAWRDRLNLALEKLNNRFGECRS